MPISTLTRRHKLRLLAALSATLVATAVYAAYPAWKPDTFYAAGTIVSYNGRDYQALVDQTDYSTTGWNPTTTSLWKRAWMIGSYYRSASGAGGPAMRAQAPFARVAACAPNASRRRA